MTSGITECSEPVRESVPAHKVKQERLFQSYKGGCQEEEDGREGEWGRIFRTPLPPHVTAGRQDHWHSLRHRRVRHSVPGREKKTVAYEFKNG